jgi:large subunit ribosomal protein L17
MFRNLAANLVMHERIETTDAKAKELRRIAERLVTRALRLGDELTIDTEKLEEHDRQRITSRRLHAERQVARFLPRRMVRTGPNGETEQIDLIHKLFNELALRYLPRVQEGRGGGYTRIIKKGFRRGDNAPMSFIEFLPAEE